MNIGNPEAARLEICRWYYVIMPPSQLSGGDCDWPGPEYEEIEREKDARHYRK